ncbi:MAG: fibronectin type III domain-containing protein [Tannerella sp.]|nr:fibronectin type III domain-containing protein [Tannerella sp.]
MMRFRYLLLILSLVTVACLPAKAQGLHSTYPVQVTAFLQPPYSLYFSDYSDPMRERILVTLLNRDLQESEVDVRLHVSITAGNGSLKMDTRDYNPIPVFRLQAGVPVKLSAMDLAPYFQLQNMEVRGYFDRRFPEGMVEICFRAYEVNTGRLVSQTSCARAWLTLNRPPLLSLPLPQAVFAFKEPQQFLFQWTPRHQALSNVEYEFILKEIRDTQTAVENAFTYSAAIFSKTISGTSLNYTAMDPPLLENTTYAWQIRAIVRQGFEEQNLFENNGYSEIRTFSIGESCKPPTGASAIQEGQYAHITWTPSDPSRVQAVAFRAQGNTDWHLQKGNADYANLFDLVPDRTYEYRVGTVCTDGSIVYGDIRTIRLEDTRKSVVENCGITTSLPVDPSQLLATLNVGDAFNAGDFPVTVTKVTGGNGVFTGEGWIRLPVFMDVKVSVKFTGIQINTDRQMVGKGYVETNYDKTESGLANLDFLNQGGATNGQTKTGDIWTDLKTDFPIPPDGKITYDPEAGTLTVTDKDGNVVGTIPLTEEQKDKLNGEGPTTLTILDKDGNIYTLTKDEEGNITSEKTGSTGNGGAWSGQFDPNGINLQDAVVTFSSSGQYAFDEWKDAYEDVALIRNKYENINGYMVACKLIPPGRTDRVSFEVTGPEKNQIDPDKIVFRSGTGTEYIAKEGEISITGGKENDAQDVYALYPIGNDKYKTLGKLKVLSYKELNLNLTLVKVKNNTIDRQSVESYLNDVYGKLGIHWNVSEDNSFSYDQEDMDSDASGLFSRETEEMKAIKAAYRATDKVDGNTVYLFILRSGHIRETGIAGDMPRRSQFGYIFTEGQSRQDILRTIAHELGHGRFELRHTFDNDYGKLVTEDNLMDYGGGTYLAKWQWDAMFDPALLVNPFEGDEEGMALKLKSIKEDIQRILENESIDNGHALLSNIINSIYIYNLIDWSLSEWSPSDIIEAMAIVGKHLIDKNILKLMKEINRIMSKRSTGDAAQLMTMTNCARDENIKPEDIGTATSLSNKMIDSDKNAATVIFGLLFEFKYGIGLEERKFKESSVMTQGVKDFYLVEDGRTDFYSKPERQQCINNLPKLHDYPAKIENKITKANAYIGSFNPLTGPPRAGLDLVKQYIGGFYMEMLPDKDGKTIEMILYNDMNLESLVFHYFYLNKIPNVQLFPKDYKRINGKITPLGETRQILRWVEPIDVNRLK